MKTFREWRTGKAIGSAGWRHPENLKVQRQHGWETSRDYTNAGTV